MPPPDAGNGGTAAPGSVRADLGRIAPYVARHGALFGASLAASLALAVIDVPVPLLLKHVLDAVLGGHHRAGFLGLALEPREALLAILGILAALAIAKGALLYAQRSVSESAGQRVVHGLRLDLYRHLQSLAPLWLRRSSTGRLMLRLMGDVQSVLDMMSGGFQRALTDAVTIGAVSVVLVILNPRLALVVLAGLPVYALAFRRLGPPLRESGRRARRERARLSGDLQEKIAGAAVVKAFAREEDEARRLEHQTRRLRDRMVERARLGGLLAALSHVAVALGAALVLWIGGRAVLDGELTKGGLMAYYAYVAMLFPPLRRLARTNETWQAARVALERIGAFLDETAGERERDGAHPLIVSSGAVRFERVSFAYEPGRPVLREVDLDVAPGEVVALVGPNGAGKTTLASLLTRFVEPGEGRVLVDGQDLRDVNLASLRRQIAFVAQEPILFSGTIGENVRYARPEATDAEVLAAARLAGVVEFVRGLPDGFDTEVGERGRLLSGGQVQRIAIARAALVDPRILVLDEATSAVDAESEARIRAALDRLMAGRTVFVIAHRASTVKRADRIVVLDAGRVAEQGTHAALLLRRGLYARLFQDALSSGGPSIPSREIPA